MKTYSSVEEMQQEYARIRVKLENPFVNYPVQTCEQFVPELEPTVDPVIQQVKIVKLEYKPNGIKTKIFWQEIIEIVEQDVGIPAFDFMSVRREKRLADPRLLVYALTADCCPYLSLPAIGRLAHRDHTTILKGRIRGRQHPSYQKLKAALLSRLSLPSVDV